LFLSDKISYQKKFFQSIEHGPVGNAFPVDYSSVAFYYSDKSHKNQIVPSMETSKVFIPDTLIIYPQLMAFNLEGKTSLETNWGYGTGGLTFIFTGNNDSWVRASLDEIPYGDYKMIFDVVKNNSGCEFSLWQRQTRVTEWISTQSETESRAQNLQIGDISIREFLNTITIRLKTNDKQNKLYLNRIILIRNNVEEN
jgi:hypothetical protein